MKLNEYQIKEHSQEEIIEVENINCQSLILYNDEFHTFDYVIEALIDVCKHTTHQAEQCTLITHYKGKCEVKCGEYNELKPMKQALIDRELTAAIE